MLEKLNHNFLSIFCYVRIFNKKLIIGVQLYKKTNGKNIKKILNIYYDVHCYLAKFEIKIQLVYGEIKKINCVMG